MAEFVLIAVPVALLGWAMWIVRRSRFTTAQTILLWISTVLARGLWRAQGNSRLPVAPHEGAVIVCNHTSPVDPWMIQLTTDRVVHWMVAREYAQHRFLSWFFRAAKSIPVNRSGMDTAATRAAIRYAESGELVAIFPEGRINEGTLLMQSGRPGAALIALKAQVPVIPCYIFDAPRGKTMLDTFFTPAKSRIIVGKRIDLSAYYDRASEAGIKEKLTLMFMKEVALLAGRPDFQPEMASRKWSKLLAD